MGNCQRYKRSRHTNEAGEGRGFVVLQNTGRAGCLFRDGAARFCLQLLAPFSDIALCFSRFSLLPTCPPTSCATTRWSPSSCRPSTCTATSSALRTCRYPSLPSLLPSPSPSWPKLLLPFRCVQLCPGFWFCRFCTFLTGHSRGEVLVPRSGHQTREMGWSCARGSSDRAFGKGSSSIEQAPQGMAARAPGAPLPWF